MLDLKLQNMLKQRQQNFELRNHLAIDNFSGAWVRLGDKEYLSFSTNNYLGLLNHPKVIAACQTALARFGVGSGSAYLVSGYTSAHQELEERLAAFLGYPKVLMFSSGYMANIGIIPALFTDYCIFADKLNHASLLDGCLAAKGYLRRYPHRQMAFLEKLLQPTEKKNCAIISEGLFGMDGTIAPLAEIYQLAVANKATILIDDAHGIGTIGLRGRGTLELYGYGFKEVPILIGTLGKSFGTYGAFVASSQLIIESLTQLTRTYLYTTALPPAIAAASIASLKLIQEEPWRRQKIRELTDYFKLSARQLGIPCIFSETPIQIILLKSNQKSLEISQQLFDRGILIKAIRPPTVPKESARLRVTITAEHTKQQINHLMENLKYVFAKN